MDHALARTLDLGRRAFAEGLSGDDAVFVDGTESLLEKPEFRGDVEALQPACSAPSRRKRGS